MKKIKNIEFLVAVSVALFTFLVYLPALQNNFVDWDDGAYVTNNSAIQILDMRFFRWAFFEFHASNWHPLTWISHAVDYAFWGLNPLGHHLTNNILHAVNTLLVVLLVIKLFEAFERNPAQNAPPAFITVQTTKFITAAVTGLLFGLHPLHVESAAWVAERKDLLCAMFFLFSAMSYLRYVGVAGNDPGNKPAGPRFFDRRYLAAFGFFALALLSKPMAVTLPLVLLLLDWYPCGRITSPKKLFSLFTEKIPFFALSIFSSVITIFAQSSGKALVPFEVQPLAFRAIVASRAIIFYLRKMVLPVDLSPYYPYPRNVSFFTPEYFLPVLLVALLTGAALASAKKSPLLPAVWGYFLIILLPVLGVIQVGGQAMADRYTYLPSIGPFLAAGLGAAWAFDRTGSFTKHRVLLLFTLSGGIAVLLCIMIYATFRQIGIWKDGFTLWDSAIQQDPAGNSLAYNNRGLILRDRGQLNEAMEDFQTALSISPDSADTLNNLGIAYYEKGLYEKAIETYGRAVSLRPDNFRAYSNLGVTYAAIGRVEMAIDNFTKAIALDPQNGVAYANLARAFRMNGQVEKAAESYRKAVELDPYNETALYGLGAIYLMLGRLDDALAAYSRFVELSPRDPEAYRGRGMAYLKKGEARKAEEDFRKACALGSRESCKEGDVQGH